MIETDNRSIFYHASYIGSDFNMVVKSRTYTNSINPKHSRFTRKTKITIINDYITRKQIAKSFSFESDA